MSTNTIFGKPISEIQRQINGPLMQPPNSPPIKRGETLEPCIRGARKLLDTPETKELVREILNP